MISRKLDILDKINANDCNVIQVNFIDAVEYLKENCINPNFDFDNAVGLTYNNVIVSLVTLDKQIINNYCDKNGFYINNGLETITSKLSKPLLITSNNRFSIEDILIENGFNFYFNVLPDFFLFRGVKVYSKYTQGDGFYLG